MQESEGRYHHLFNELNDAAFVAEVETGVIIEANQQAEVLLGKGLDEIIGMHQSELHPPDKAEQYRAMFAAHIGKGQAADFNAQVVRKDGTIVPVSISASTLTVGSNHLIVGLFRDMTEPKRAEEALRDSESKYRTLLENLPQKVFFKDTNSVYISCNESYARDLGLTPDEIAGHTDYDFYPKELAEKYRADDSRIMQSGETEDIEEDYIQDGQPVVVHTVKTPVRDENGNVLGILGIFWDVTTRKRTEEALQQAYDRLETVLATSMDGFMTVGLDGRITECNEAYCKTLGYSRDELLTMRITDVDAMESAEETAQHIEQVMRTGRDRFETAHRRKDGSIVDVEISTTLVQLPEESLFVSFGRDITERKRTEEALRESEEFSASLVSHSAYPTMAINPDTSIRYVNPALEEVTGFSSAELVGRKAPYPFWTEEILEQTGRDFAAAVQQSAQRREELFQTKDRERFWVEITSIPIQRDGQLDYYFANWADITERKRIEADLAQSAKMMSLATMAAGIAHGVRNPLATISSCALLLQEHCDDEEIRNQCIEKIDAASRRASLVIESLLKFTHPEEDHIQEVNLNAVLEEAIALLAHNMEQQGITLRKDFQPDLPNVMGTPALLQQVFVNLMVNAGAATSEGGRLTLTTRTTAAGEVAIEFADTGRGIRPEDLPKIFDPFFTAMPSGEGIGLGLAISYGVIQQHKGTIEVDSQPGQGSTFTVRLPGVAE